MDILLLVLLQRDFKYRTQRSFLKSFYGLSGSRNGP